MDPQRPSFLLVDGNNILHAWDELRPTLLRSAEQARTELIRRLTDWSDDSDERIVLAFDGGTRSARNERREGRIQVIYGGAGETADAVIERLVLKYAASYRLTVATDDRAVRDLSAAAGAEVISAGLLQDRLEAGLRARQEWLRRHRRRKP
jgi:predicted RNA-binding protein with PIN domain